MLQQDDGCGRWEKRPERNLNRNHSDSEKGVINSD